MSRLQSTALFGVLVLATVLRLVGITWGVPSPEYPHRPFHPDEAWAMEVLCDAQPAAGDFVVEEAHREGALLAHLVLGQALLLERVGVIGDLPCSYALDGPPHATADYRRVLLAGRILVASMDVLSVLVILLLLRKIVDPWPALAAAGLFAILPFEVVHAHYMRTHVPANLMILLVLYASVGLTERTSRRRLIVVGALCGMATAMRYTSGVVTLVPALLVVAHHWRSRDGERSSGSFVRPVVRDGALLAVALLGGLFVADPPLFLAFEEILPHMGRQMGYAATQEFSWARLFDLERVWAYLTYLMPHAAGLGLWLVLVAATVYSLFLRRYYRLTLPWLAMNLVYLYAMAKGYAKPVYARAALSLFPVLVLTAGVAFHDVASRLRHRPRLRGALVLLLALVAAWTLVLDAAHLRALVGERDARYQVRSHLLAQDLETPFYVGIPFSTRTEYFTTYPAFVLDRPYSARFRQAEELEAGAAVDFLALTAYKRPYERMIERREAVIAGDVFGGRTFESELSALPDLSFLGLRFDYRDLPADMRYPFVEIYVLRPVAMDDGRYTPGGP